MRLTVYRIGIPGKSPLLIPNELPQSHRYLLELNRKRTHAGLDAMQHFARPQSCDNLTKYKMISFKSNVTGKESDSNE